MLRESLQYISQPEATKMLLDHGVNPNVQDANGNSLFHTIYNQRDIQMATHIIKNNGRVLQNKKMEKPALPKLFFNQDKEEIEKLMASVDLSKHRIENSSGKSTCYSGWLKKTSLGSFPSF